MSILNKAQNDFLKNKDIVEFYGDSNNNTTSGDTISLFGSVKSKNNLLKLNEEEEIPDENLLDDLA